MFGELLQFKTVNGKNPGDDDFRSGCRNVGQCHQQQSFSGLLSPGRSNHTNDCYSLFESYMQIITKVSFCSQVLLYTTCGEIEIELWSKEAPKACRNFVQLCLEGYYDGTIFHRIVKGKQRS